MLTIWDRECTELMCVALGIFESCQTQLWSQSAKCIKYTDDGQINRKFQARLDTFFPFVCTGANLNYWFVATPHEAPTII